MTQTSSRQAYPGIRLAVSACLLGEPVRYDGGHKRHAFLTDSLAAHVDYLPVCPEAGIGMGIPRPPIQLIGDRQRPRALGVDDAALDVTARLESFAATTLGGLHDVSGYIFKKNSPSCGLRQVKLRARPDLPARREGTGIFARVVTESLPLLPVLEEDGLDDPVRRENFFCRVYVYRRWQELQTRGISAAGLRDFHVTHTYLIMAHSQAACRRLKRLLPDLPGQPSAHTTDAYIGELMAALARPSRRGGHYKVLQQLAGALDPWINHTQKTALATRLNAYRDGHLSLGEAVTGLQRQFDRHPEADTGGAAHLYLHPYPDSLPLRDTL